MSNSANKSRYKTAPRAFSPTRDPKLVLIKERINQIASNMRNPLKPSNKSLVLDSQAKETRIRTPKMKEKQRIDTIEGFLSFHGFENYINLFLENQITMQDIPCLTKDDLIDMKMPIGPRNRLLKIIETMDTQEVVSVYEPSPRKFGLRDEVDRFMSELSQFSKRSEAKIRPSSREQSLEASFDSEMNSQKLCESILVVLKDIRDKQVYMMKAIEDNQQAINSLKKQNFYSKSRGSTSDYR